MIVRVRATCALLGLLALAFAFYTSDDDRRLAAFLVATAFGQMACVQRSMRWSWGSVPVSLAILLAVTMSDSGWGFGIADYPALFAISVAFAMLLIADPTHIGAALAIAITTLPAILFFVMPGVIDFSLLRIGNPSTVLAASMTAACCASIGTFLIPPKKGFLWYTSEFVIVLALTWLFDAAFVQYRFL